MAFRHKKIMFTNNKGGVGKTTLAYHVGCELGKNRTKVALIDLDSQCNLSILALGFDFYDQNPQNTIFDVLEPKINASADMNLDVPLTKVDDNIYILPGDLRLSLFENILMTAYGEATSGLMRGYSDTSAINRYLDYIAQKYDISVFIIDTSPSLSILNRIIFLSSDMFIVPITPNAFSVQGIKNLGDIFYDWRIKWKNTAKAPVVAGQTPNNYVLQGDPLFIGYIENNYNVYAKRTLVRQDYWLSKIPEIVCDYLSKKHGRNGLVDSSWRTPLGQFQDMSQLIPISMENKTAIQNLELGKIKELNLKGTKELHEKAIKSMSDLHDNLLKILDNY